jgi:spore coat polysaccharide biosynthesis predicted glycosyltransferase SpsG
MASENPTTENKQKSCDPLLKDHDKIGNPSDLKELLKHCQYAVNESGKAVDEYVSIIFIIVILVLITHKCQRNLYFFKFCLHMANPRHVK